jgi:hypothetical protein
MSRLDSHVLAVRNKLALARFASALAWTLLAFGAAVALVIVVLRAFRFGLPWPAYFFWGGLGASVLAAIIYAMVRRPTPQLAAVAIDKELGLKEKFSTALFIRPHASQDPFAAAAVRDAEKTADDVNLRRRFPLGFPRAAYGTVVMACIAGLVAWLMPTMDLFGREAAHQKQVAVQQKQAEAEKMVRKALATVEAVPKTVADAEAIKNAKIDLRNLLNQPIKDPQAANRSALKALQDVQQALKQQAEQNARYAEAQNQMKQMKNLAPAPEEKNPVANAQREMAKGEFTEAVNELQKAVSNFDKMSEEEKKQVTQQMQKLSQQLQQMAGDPQKQQQQIQKQLQQLGMNQQQAQQMAQQMQQAAQGNQQAAQQLQQQAQQMMQQMNNGQGPNQQQQQQIQQMMQQMQAQMNSTAAAQQMAQAAQQMAQAMQQAQQQQGQQANGQQQGAQGQQAGGQQGMGQAMQQMQQQLAQLDAAAKDAEAVQAAQQNIQIAEGQAAGNMNGQNQGEGGDEAKDGGTGKWDAGDPQQVGQGQGGPGIGMGGRGGKAPAPYGVKPEFSSSQDNGKGKILAANLVKDNKPLKGASNLSLKEVAAAAEKEAPEEVDQERVSRQAQTAVKEYFRSFEEDAGAAASENPAPPQTPPAPAPAPAPTGGGK